FSRGLGTIKDLYSGDQTASVGGYDVPSGPLAAGAGFAKGLAGFAGGAGLPKQLVRPSVGLDPYGSATQDLQNLGMGRVPSAWIGSFADTFGDPMLATGALGRMAAPSKATATKVAVSAAQRAPQAETATGQLSRGLRQGFRDFMGNETGG